MSRITNPKIDGCGNGIYIGEGVKNGIIINPVISNCSGHGIKVANNSDVLVTSPHISNVGKDAIHFFDQNLSEKLGLPDSVDNKQLIDLIRLLQQTPENQRQEKITSSFLSNFNNLSGIANNILQMLPNLPQL